MTLFNIPSSFIIWIELINFKFFLFWISQVSVNIYLVYFLFPFFILFKVMDFLYTFTFRLIHLGCDTYVLATVLCCFLQLFVILGIFLEILDWTFYWSHRSRFSFYFSCLSDTSFVDILPSILLIFSLDEHTSLSLKVYGILIFPHLKHWHKLGVSCLAMWRFLDLSIL